MILRKGQTMSVPTRVMAVDIGNTNTVIGIFEGARFLAHWRIATDRARLADEHAMLLQALFDHARLPWDSLGGTIIASVVPPLTGIWTDVCQRYLHISPLVVSEGVEVGVRILTEHPAEVGVDRVVNSLAAFRRYGGPCIVIDFGTATTFDIVSSQGDYLGGAIAPGLGIAAEALTSRTAKLPRIELEPPPHAIGKNTRHAMQSGLMFGYAGLVEGLVRRIQAELPDGPAKVIATGGLAEVIARLTPTIEAVDPWLTLEGLRLIYELNSHDPTW
jgi:type III pantothenate kinase